MTSITAEVNNHMPEMEIFFISTVGRTASVRLTQPSNRTSPAYNEGSVSRKEKTPTGDNRLGKKSSIGEFSVYGRPETIFQT
jgi:hypothetical protein